MLILLINILLLIKLNFIYYFIILYYYIIYYIIIIIFSSMVVEQFKYSEYSHLRISKLRIKKNLEDRIDKNIFNLSYYIVKIFSELYKNVMLSFQLNNTTTR